MFLIFANELAIHASIPITTVWLNEEKRFQLASTVFHLMISVMIGLILVFTRVWVKNLFIVTTY